MKSTKIKLFKFDELTTEQQVRWLEKQTEKVIERLPTLKKHLTMYNDRSDELYNMSAEEIKLITSTNISDIKSGRTTRGLGSYANQLNKYANLTYAELRLETTNQRIDSFMDSLERSGASQAEIDHCKELLDRMSDKDKENFVRSKFFWNYGDYNSSGVRNFFNENGCTIETANLENWCEQHNILGATDDKYYVNEGTYHNLGRPPKK